MKYLDCISLLRRLAEHVHEIRVLGERRGEGFDVVCVRCRDDSSTSRSEDPMPRTS
jgi:hypothetical protein